MHRLVVLVAVLGASTLAHANVEIGGTAGLHIFSDSNALGVPAMAPAPTTEKNTAMFGLRLGVYFNPHLGIELEAGILPDEPVSMVFDVMNITYRAQLAYQFRTEKNENSFIPFVLAGGGMIQVVQTKNADILKTDAKPEFYVGGGVKYRAASDWGLRLDLRVIGTSKFTGAGADLKTSGLTEDFEALVSLYKEFGRKKAVEKKLAPPPVDDDPDKDGIHGAADKCPNEAEDKDGFQDEDGCPDPDNDGDGIPDAQDKCPKEPETKNGYMDDDGCPDEIPEKLKKFTGAIQGITFNTGSADLAPASNRILDQALAVLVEFKDVKLEIQGHTDDQPLKASKKFADNAALSQARADSVKAYFVKKGVDEARLASKGYGDTQPVEDPKGLTGAKLNAARGKNRRVEFKLVSNPGVMVPDPAATPAPAPPPAPAPAPAP